MSTHTTARHAGTLTFFPNDTKKLLDGHITATLRTKASLKPGEVFYAGESGMRCMVIAVRRISVGQAATLHHKQLGFDSANAFLDHWREIHPNIGDKLDRRMFLYRFKRIVLPEPKEAFND